MTEALELTSARHNELLRLTINRPAAANAINRAVAICLEEALAQAMLDDTVRAVIITGTGSRVFCAGRDLKNPLQLTPDALSQARREESIAYTEALMAFEKPLVVAINGAAIGAGLMLALHADQVVAADHAFVSLPEIDIGIATFLGHTLVAELVGQSVANDLVLTGRRINATEAKQRGLIHDVVPGSALLAAAEARARFLGAKPPSTFRAMKRWILERRRTMVRAAFAAHDALDSAERSA